MKNYYAYILAFKKNGTLYIRVTNDLLRRVYEHKSGLIEKLVYFEQCINVQEAIRREKQLKWWKRQWKIYLIGGVNPNWNDLYGDLI